MEIPAPSALIEQVSALPGAPELLRRLAGQPGVYLVGGAVRDLLLGRNPRELDLLVEGDPAAVAARLGGAQRTHDRFGTCTVVLGGLRYDIARARRETYASPGALPTVTPGTASEDLLRRDFTVNAMAIGMSGEAAGLLRTAPGALEDLAAGRLRVLHERSFRDDPTRLLRLARYAARLGFEVEPHTLGLAHEAIGAGALDRVSGTRIGNELRLLAREDRPVEAFAALSELGLTESVIPGMRAVDPALATRTLALLPGDGRRDLLMIALATCECTAEGLASGLDRLAFEAGDREAILEAATGARGLARALDAARSPSEIAAAAAGARAETVALAGGLGPDTRAREWLTRLRHVRLEIDGGDLLSAGIEQGPGIGAGLRAALAAKLDGRLSGREPELAEAVRAATASG